MLIIIQINHIELRIINYCQLFNKLKSLKILTIFIVRIGKKFCINICYRLPSEVILNEHGLFDILHLDRYSYYACSFINCPVSSAMKEPIVIAHSNPRLRGAIWFPVA